MISLNQEGTGSVRFGSVRFGSGLSEHSSVRFASVRFVICPCSAQFGLRFSDASWLGPVWFGLFPHPVYILFLPVRLCILYA